MVFAATKNEPPRRVTAMTQRGITAMAGILIVLNLSLIGLTGWKIWQYNQPAKPAASSSAEETAVVNARTVSSANGGFSLTFPAGWDNVLRVTNGDRFMVVGPEQPWIRDDVPAAIKDVASFDDPKHIVFEAAIADNFVAPQGEANDLLIGKDKYLLSGRRYVLTYEGNDVNAQRANGDKDYVYSFALGGKRELRVTYRVYADDPTDNNKAVETIVRSIRKLK